MPEISVILPNYNHAPFLKQRIDSILHQTFQDFELIILDDCSTDNSREIIELYRNHPKVSHIIYNSINSSSTFIQWNKGFKLAKGEYIWIAESDDYADITFLEKLTKAVAENKNTAIAYSTSYFVNEKGEITRNGLRSEPYLKAKARGKLYKIYNGVGYIKKHLIDNNDIYNASSAIFKKSFLSSISQEYMNYKSCGDNLFWIELAAQGKVMYYYENLNYFRQHNSKVTPKSLSGGLLFEEELKIFHYNIKKGYVYWANKLLVIGRYLAWMNTVQFDPDEKKYELRAMWEKETSFPILSLRLYKMKECWFRVKFKFIRIFN